MYNIKKTLKKKGFTLIELMLVTSIILVLMGFLVPKFSAYENKVKETKAKNTAKQIQTAAMARYGDNNGEFLLDDVKSNINNLTSAESVIVNNPYNDNQSVQINYKSDNKDYTVMIDAENNTYTVN